MRSHLKPTKVIGAVIVLQASYATSRREATRRRTFLRDDGGLAVLDIGGDALCW